VDLFFFDFDKTLYAYDSRKRLPALSIASGVSQYHIAKTWWQGGFEIRAESGEWPTAVEYLAEFERITGAAITLEQWQQARALASTRIAGSIDALRRAASIGTACVLSNNPSVFAESLPVLAPDVVAIVGDNRLVSCELGVRKPDPQVFELALGRFNARPKDTFFVDDSAANVAGAASVGIHTHHLVYLNGVPQVDGLHAAIERFAARKK
jgi:putative hydrolase of the HAD superfamily